MTETPPPAGLDQFWGWVFAVGKLLGSLALIASVTTAFFMAIFSLGEPRLRVFLRGLTDAPLSEARLDDLAGQMNGLQNSLDKVIARLDAVHPMRLVNVDLSRSNIVSHDQQVGVCYREKVCEVQFLVQRTDFGASCGAASVRRMLVMDEDRTTRSVYVVDRPGEGRPPPSDSFERRSIFFGINQRTPPGRHELILELAVACPNGPATQELKQVFFELKLNDEDNG